MSTATAKPRAAGTLFSIGWRTRLGSILAVVPLGLWVANHLFQNLLAFEGAGAWEAKVTGAESAVAELAISVLVIAPIVIHAIWGLARIRHTRPNLGRFMTFENLRFILQRVSALGILFFIPAHLYLARIQPALASEGGHIKLAEFAEHMHQVPTLIVYLLGTLGVAFHLANGLWGFLVHMGWYSGKDAQLRLRNVCIVLFVVLLAMAWGSIAGVRAALLT